MMLYWTIRYFDRASRSFKGRNLHLLTDTLDPVTRAAVELAAEYRTHQGGRGILPFRNLFAETDLLPNPAELSEIDRFACVGPDEYFEDDAGQEITLQEMGPLLTGSPTAVLIPSGSEKHDIDLILSERTPLPVAEVSLTLDEVRLLGYFARDLKEMLDSAFRRDGPGKLKMIGAFTISPGTVPTLETAVTDEEVGAFVTIFRRLYMESEPGNFLKAADAFVRAVGDHSYGRWVAGVVGKYRNQLAAAPDVVPFLPAGQCKFTAERLIDAFIYTQYAHQPNEKRRRHFAECLADVHGQHSVLLWLFLTTIWQVSLEVGNAGRVISNWFRRYCDHHQVAPDMLTTPRHDYAALGAVEKEAGRRERLFREQVEKLAARLWVERGRPECGPSGCTAEAEQLLRAKLES